MLRCKDLSDLSEDYLDGNLPIGKKLAIMLHIALCRHCRRYLRQLQLTKTIIGRQQDAATRFDEQASIDSIMQRIEVEQEAKANSD